MYEHPDFSGLYVVDHPVVQHKLTLMRDKSCSPGRFRALLKDISQLMCFPVTEKFPVGTTLIETPLISMDAPILACRDPLIVPILRAGVGMTDGLLAVFQDAVIGHVGVFRDEQTHLPSEYLVRLPDPLPEDRPIIIVDPMLATGNSAAHVVDVLLKRGADLSNIIFMCLVAAPEGVAAFKAKFPEIPVFTAALDQRLNERAYIVPGLGDAGDRIFGTI